MIYVWRLSPKFSADAGSYSLFGIDAPGSSSRDPSPSPKKHTSNDSAPDAVTALLSSGMSPQSGNMSKKDEDGSTLEGHPHFHRSKKWSQFRSGSILELDAETVPSFPSYEEVVGIITMEDVIEELLQVIHLFANSSAFV